MERLPRIEQYGLIGDMQTSAHVCDDGSIDWLCLPRFDSPAVFAGLLGTQKHGTWQIAPASPPPVPAPKRKPNAGTAVTHSSSNRCGASRPVRSASWISFRHATGHLRWSGS
jgi:hypothetical protein